MKLLSIELFGQYKGLRDQAFDFSSVNGDVAVLIGANGSGKSQVMELIAEAFAFLERWQRRDFRVRAPLGYDFRVTYEMASSRYDGLRRFAVDTRDGLRISVHQHAYQPHDGVAQLAQGVWSEVTACGSLEELALPRVIGYASGLSENLQRAFMRNALQYFDVIRVRANLKKELAQPKVDEEATLAINERYLRRNPGIFAAEGADPESGLFRLRETDTAIPRNLFLDYDCAALLIATLGMLSHTDRDEVWNEIPFHFRKVDGVTDMTNPSGETFGASFDVLIKKHFNLRATISETAVQEIRERLADRQFTNQQKLDWLEDSVGESMERAYLINKLRAS